jgi:hypothetical protein
MRLRQKDPTVPGIEGMLGKACFQSKRFPQAIQHLKTALQQNPGDSELAQILTLRDYASGDDRQALPLLEETSCTDSESTVWQV